MATLPIDDNVAMPTCVRGKDYATFAPHIRKLVAITGHKNSVKASAKDWGCSPSMVRSCMREFPDA